MLHLSNISMRLKLLMLAGTFAAGFLAFAAVSFFTLSSVKINGTNYQKIIANKDLIADVLPPPMYVVEHLLVCHQIKEAKSEAERNDLLERLVVLERDCKAREKYWQESMPEGTLKTTLFADAMRHGDAFFEVVKGEFIPAVKSGDSARVAAVFENSLNPTFTKHKTAIEQVVAQAAEQSSAEESRVAGLISSSTWTLTALCILVFLGVTAFSVWMGSKISSQIRAIVEVVKEVASGNLNGNLVVHGTDELSQTAGAINKMIQDLKTQKQRELESAQRERQLAEEQQQRADLLQAQATSLLASVELAAQGDLTTEIEITSNDAVGQIGQGLNRFLADMRRNITAIAHNAQALAGASEELTSVSLQMNHNAQETANQANVVSSASEQVSQNSQSVATSIQEMNSTIREIAKNASDATRVASQAVTAAELANTSVTKLGDSSAEIGKVIDVITSIAEQTNLLALNATIEAARAGEAGKGFAVVANEVKELAKETARATEDIRQRIQTIQSDTGNAVSAIREIGGVINQINDISNTIATAVEEQTATTNEIQRSISETAQGSNDIACNIASVAQNAQSTTQGANDAQQAAAELARMASELQQLVSQFTFEKVNVPSRSAASTMVSARRSSALAVDVATPVGTAT